MKRYLQLIIIFFSISLSSSCSGQDCSTLNKNFQSYESALTAIKSSEFKFSDDCNTSNSSWIYNAEYFSCDKETGFLLIETKSKTYIHKDVPLQTWNEFKKAESFGKYYNQKIKSRFQLIL